MFTFLCILCMFEFVSRFYMLSINNDDSNESKNMLTRGIMYFFNNFFSRDSLLFATILILLDINCK
jgi:hypothetical protein